MSALRYDKVGFGFGRFHKLLVHGLYGAEILVDYRLHTSAALVYVATETANKPHVGVGVYKQFDVAQFAQRGVGINKYAFDDNYTRALRALPLAVATILEPDCVLK